MAKFAFIVPPLTGHVNPTLSIGAALLEAGHEAGWITPDSSLGSKIPQGGQLLPIRYMEEDREEQENEKYLDMISKKIVYGVDSIKFLYEEVLIPLNRYSFKGIVRWLDRWQPDVVITDHELFAGAVAALRLGIPYVTLITAPAAIKVMDELPKVYEWQQNQIVALQQELGLSATSSVACSGLLNLVLSSAEFFGGLKLPAHFRFVGPVTAQRKTESAFNWLRFQQETETSKVLVSIGTTFNHEHKRSFFARVTEALGNGPYTVVVVSDPALFAQWPDNFIVQQQIPQLELLPHLDAVICHGGHNTVCESLSNGLPLVVVPIAYDQSDVAGSVVKTGAGLRLNFNRFKARHLREAVEEILHNKNYKSAAVTIRNSFMAAGGTKAAADLLISLSRDESAVPSYV